MKNERRYNRLGERYGARVFFTFLGTAILVIILASLIWAINEHERRMTVVVAADPTLVATFDFNRHRLILLSFPASAQIPGIHGVGQYSLASLWRLGFLDPKDPMMLAGSLTELIGVPIERYLGFKNDQEIYDTHGLSGLRKIFSLTGIINFFRGRYISNLNVADYLSFSWQMHGLRPDNITTLVVNNHAVLYDQKLPDGTVVAAVDPNKLHALIGENFEDKMLRSESLRVAIYNTTQTPELGSRVEMLLTHAGILVVLVGNKMPEINECQVVGSKQSLVSLTAKFIGKTYGCRMIEIYNGGRADLEVKIGRDFEKLFLPKD